MIRIQGQNTTGVSSVNEVKLSASDKEFIDRVNNRITIFGQIPYTVPEKMIVELIKSSARYFYKFDAKTWSRKTIYITAPNLQRWLDDVAVTNQPNLNALSGHSTNFGVQLTNDIMVVRGVREMQTIRDNELTQAMDLTTYGGTAGAIGINNNLFIIERACVAQERKVFDAVFKSTIIFDYSPATHFLTIFNRTHHGLSMILDVEKAIPVDYLYQDSYFERHVIASCKRELKRLLAGHVFELPGGVTMNADEICAGSDDAEKVEELLKNAGGVGDIILKRNG
jgi:hypothetical protein